MWLPLREVETTSLDYLRTPTALRMASGGDPVAQEGVSATSVGQLLPTNQRNAKHRTQDFHREATSDATAHRLSDCSN
jgi:hypothetical protein